MKKVHNYFFAAFDLVDSFFYDIWRYLHYSQFFARFRSSATARYYLLKTVHRLEKGLALQGRRAGFGKGSCSGLIAETQFYQNQFGADPVCIYVRNVVKRVLEFHVQTGDEDAELQKEFDDFDRAILQPESSFDECGGLRSVRKQEIIKNLPPDPFAFFATRHSVRQFSDTEIGLEKIREAIRIAQRAPSVCNRQSCRVHYTTDKETVLKVLAHQKGGAGFGENAAAIFVITSELAAFNRAGERNQCYVDGGIFAQTFALGMHALGHGTCYLNWSKSAREDRLLRRSFTIPASETIITLIAAGCLRDEFVVAASPRLPTDEVFKPLSAV